jgi:plastocyanin
MTRIALAALLCAACGGDDGGGGTPDAKLADAASNAKVQAVTCPATVDATVTTSTTADEYAPKATTVAVNAVVKFVMPGSHNVIPDNSTSTDAALVVNFSETKCFKFTAAGTYGFLCAPHGFKGTVTVQ